MYRFGEFRLDPASRGLWHGDEELALPRKVFDCVLYLIEHRERAVEREELFAAVWGDVHVSDGVLAQTILEARRALHDSGDEQRFIKTIRGFGYHWVAPVGTVEPPTGPVEAPAAPAKARGGPVPRPLWLGIALALLAVGALTGATIYLSRDATRDAPPHDASAIHDADLALVLPVIVAADERHAWIRLGLMDSIAERLRAAGQSMVPSDTVIALMRGRSSEPDPDALESLTAATGARLVLQARAENRGRLWWVSLHGVTKNRPAPTAVGEAEDVLAAARVAADRMARALGRTPAPEPDAEPRLTRLLQQVTAARLAQEMDVARALIENADPELRRHPEIRLQGARIELHGHRLDAAQTAFESLLAETPAERDPVLRARILYGLGTVHIRRNAPDVAGPFLEEAMDVLGEGGRKETSRVSSRLRNALGVVASMQHDVEAARVHLMRARATLEGVGDVLYMAGLLNNLGVLGVQSERYAEAQRYFEGAAERHAATHDVVGELRARANVIYAHLGLLEPDAALALEPHLSELAARTTNPSTIAHANLAKVELLAAVGRRQAAERLLSEILSTTEGSDELRDLGAEALVSLAELAARGGDPAQAARAAAQAVEQLPAHDIGLYKGRAWASLILVRAHLALGRRAAASEAANTLTELAESSDVLSARIYAALARAELAAANGRASAAETAFEEALTLASTRPAPLRLLHVAERYVSWLLTERPRGIPYPERAIVVASRVAGYADRDFHAALLQLRLYHAIGPPTAWRSALTRARALAGERKIPEDLRAAPQDVRVATKG